MNQNLIRLAFGEGFKPSQNRSLSRSCPFDQQHAIDFGKRSLGLRLLSKRNNDYYGTGTGKLKGFHRMAYDRLSIPLRELLGNVHSGPAATPGRNDDGCEGGLVGTY